jgi:zinc protease
MIRPLAALVALLAAAAQAQPYDTPPRPGEPRPLVIAAPTEKTLPNGLRVVVAERRGAPLVTARLLLLSGSETDPPQRAGLASLTAGLLTRGTRTHSATALANAAEALGGSLESGAGWNQANVGITVTTPLLSRALALVSEVALQPTFAPAEIERLRAQSLDELKVSYAKPGTIAGLAAQRAVFGSGAYGHPVAGTPGSLPRLSRADIVKLHAAGYRPDNAVLVLAGDIDMAQALKLATQHFGGWKKPASPLAKSPAPTGAAWPDEVVVIDMPGAGQAAVALAMPAIPRDAPEEPAGRVANTVLGSGYSSRLNQEIRIKRGLSYGATSVLDARRQAGALRVEVQTKNPSAAEVLGLVSTELDSLAKAAVPADELAARKATLIGNFSRNVETTAGLSGEVVALVVGGVALAELPKRIDRLTAVEAGDVQAFAAKVFEASRRRAVIAGVAGEFEAGVKAMGLAVRVLKQEALEVEQP